MKLLGITILIVVFTLGYSQNSCEFGGLVFIDDLALQNILIEELGPIDAYTCEGLQQLTRISAIGKGIKSLNGLENASNLQTLVLTNNEITDFSPILELENLTALVLRRNKISQLPNLLGLKNLKNLNISKNEIVNIDTIGDLRELKTLSIGENPITYENLLPIVSLEKLVNLNIDSLNLSSLQQVFSLLYDYQNLKILNLNNNSISDLSLLPNFVSLERFTAVGNRIVNLGSFSQGFKNLKFVDLSDNRIVDIGPLFSVSSLETINIKENEIGVLESSSILGALETLNVEKNKISYIGDLSGFINLKSLVINNNRVSDITAFGDLSSLEQLYASNNYIVDLSALKFLNKLSVVILSSNRIKSIDVLSQNTDLRQIVVSGNYINSVKDFIETSSFGDIPKSVIRVAANCLTEYDFSGFSGLVNKGVTITYGAQRNLNSVQCVKGEPKPLFEISIDGSSPINIGR